MIGGTGAELRAPFFEIGPKNRLRLAPLEMVARRAGRAAREHDVTVVMTVPTALIGPLSAQNPGVLLFAQGMDPDEMGDGVGRVTAESLVDAGAVGVMLNHDSLPLTPEVLATTVRRARECGLLTIVCAATEAAVQEVAELGPTAILYEPPALIGTATAGEREWIGPVGAAVRQRTPGVLVMHAGGVGSPGTAAAIMRSGADGTGSTSGVLGAAEPLTAVREFIAATRSGWDAAPHRFATRPRAGNDHEQTHEQTHEGLREAAGEGALP